MRYFFVGFSTFVLAFAAGLLAVYLWVVYIAMPYGPIALLTIFVPFISVWFYPEFVKFGKAILREK